jgi:hypothetical protein
MTWWTFNTNSRWRNAGAGARSPPPTGSESPSAERCFGAKALPRHLGYGRGITFYTWTSYTWTSDQYSQFGTKVISTTVRDATYVLDEILDNETELTI